jgi:uncharacterized protein (TIGR02391 family)
MPAIPSLSQPILQTLCDVLGDTSTGLTGSDIGRYLARAGIDDPMPADTKRYRLFQALAACQRWDGCANNVFAFVVAVMAPVNYLGSSQLFEDRRAAVNEVLAFAGLSIGVDGQLSTRAVARTLSEAEQRARSLRKELQRRGAHAEVLRFCRAELLQDNYFHAVLEAAKSLAERLRQMTGVQADGARLVDQVLEAGSGSGGLPLVAFNSLATDTDRSEHRGLTFMIRGVFSAFRNPTAHEPKILRPVGEQDGTDLLTTISLLHRKLDAAVLTRSGPDL